jgi:uncharacterized membrane protein
MPAGASRTHTGHMTQEPITPRPATRPVPPGQLAWLERELAGWRDAGIVDAAQAQAIRSRYVGARRFSLTRLLVFVGGGFIGVGLLWLVATNLADLSPLLRFTVVTALWLGFVATAEVLAGRRAHRGVDAEDGPGPIVGAFRLISALAFGAVVFQAAQSLQVPAFEPTLVGVWGVGALLYAYAVAGVAPLLVGIFASTGWYVWQVFETSQDGMGFVLPVLLAAVVAAAVAVAHAERRGGAFAPSWREVSALLALLGLFVAAFPYVDVDEFAWSVPLVVGLFVVATVAAAAAVLASGPGRLEVLAPVLAVVAGVLLVLWEAPDPVDGVVSGEGYAHAFVSVAAYVIAAGWYAVLGVLRDSARLTVLATAALVLFTTVQSFAVFAPIVTGATLFLVLGVILLGSGYLFDRGRRRLVANLEGTTA